MDILAGLKDKLRFIERHYNAASFPFREVRRKIEAKEEPFQPPPFDPDNYGGEPPFLDEYLDATESLNIEGQAALKLVQSALRKYLSSFVDLYGTPMTAKGKNWIERYKKHFLDTYGIDFDKAPIPLEQVEEVNFARNDLEHGEETFGMSRRQSQEHEARFPGGLFVDELDKEILKRGSTWPCRIVVTETNLKEAIRRVEEFCEFIDGQQPY